MSKIKLTDSEVAMLDFIIAMKKGEQEDAGFVEFSKPETTRDRQNIRELIAKATRRIGDDLVKDKTIMDQWAARWAAMKGPEKPIDELLKEWAETRSEEIPVETLTLDELIELRKSISKN